MTAEVARFAGTAEVTVSAEAAGTLEGLGPHFLDTDLSITRCTGHTTLLTRVRKTPKSCRLGVIGHYRIARIAKHRMTMGPGSLEYCRREDREDCKSAKLGSSAMSGVCVGNLGELLLFDFSRMPSWHGQL